MKRRLLLIAALMMSAAIVAGAAVTPSDVKSGLVHKGQTQQMLRGVPNGTIAKADGIIELTAEDDTAITEAPAGRTVQYVRSADAIYYTSSGYKEEGVAGNITNIVFTDNGEVYWYNPNTKWSTNSYLKGELKDGVVTFDLPQYVLKVGSTLVYITMQTPNGKAIEDSEFGAEKSENQQLQFSYDESGTLTQIGTDMVSFTSKDGTSWYGYGDSHIVMVPYVSNALTDIDLPSEDYIYTYDGNTGHEIKVAKDGNDIYFGNLFVKAPKVWIKGKIEGDKAIFEPQSIGLIEGSDAYFVPARKTIKEVYYEQYDYTQYLPVYTALDQLVFTYDAATDRYTTDEDVVILSNPSIDEEVCNSPISVYLYPTIRRQGDVSKAIPANPEIYGFYNYFSYWGEYDFDFYLNKLSTEGSLLDEDKLYYNILLDGHPMTFEAGDYGISDDVEDVPYSLEVAEKIIHFDIERVIAIFYDGFETVGVQIIYRPEDGVEYRSDIAQYDLKTKESSIVEYTGENPAGAEDALLEGQVNAVTYYDLSGRRVANPSSGIYVKRITYADGSVKTAKQVIK
jgi:hypothetical protein